jgi:hypothetical protein
VVSKDSNSAQYIRRGEGSGGREGAEENEKRRREGSYGSGQRN